MTLTELQSLLSDNPPAALRIVLPTGAEVPAHFHITEVGHVRKTFIDCGGTVRDLSTCLLQVWVEKDFDHRLDSKKLLKILQMSEKIMPNGDLPVEFEYEGEAVSQYPLDFAFAGNGEILLNLGVKHTDCLAKEICMVGSACGPEGCC